MYHTLVFIISTGRIVHFWRDTPADALDVTRRFADCSFLIGRYAHTGRVTWHDIFKHLRHA